MLKLPEEAEKIEIFPKFQRWMKKMNIFKCKSSEVHFIIRNRVPYNKLLTNLAFSSRTGKYPRSFSVTTLRQYSPVRPLRLVSKQLILHKNRREKKENAAMHGDALIILVPCNWL